MTKNREFREASSRDNQEREAFEREPNFQENLGQLHLDTSNLPDDMTYGWVVTDLRGKPASDKFDESLGRGWEPVLADEYAGLQNKRNADIMRNVYKRSEDTYIRRGGQILCKRPKKLHESEQKFYADQQKQRRNVGSAEGLVKQADEVSYAPLSQQMIIADGQRTSPHSFF